MYKKKKSCWNQYWGCHISTPGLAELHCSGNSQNWDLYTRTACKIFQLPEVQRQDIVTVMDLWGKSPWQICNLLQLSDLWKSGRSPGPSAPKMPERSKEPELGWVELPQTLHKSAPAKEMSFWRDRKCIPWRLGGCQSTCLQWHSVESQNGSRVWLYGPWGTPSANPLPLEGSTSTCPKICKAKPCIQFVGADPLGSPALSFPQHPPLLQHLLLPFPLTKEKLFCFWLLKIIMVQESGLRMMETTPDQWLQPQERRRSKLGCARCPCLCQGWSWMGWENPSIQTILELCVSHEHSWEKGAVQYNPVTARIFLTVPMPTESGACSDLSWAAPDPNFLKSLIF